MKREIIFQTLIDTPLGQLLTQATSEQLITLEYNQPKRLELLENRLRKHLGTWQAVEEKNDILCMIEKWLQQYFEQNFSSVSHIPIRYLGSAFEISIWKEMSLIPIGMTVSYQKLAQSILRPLACRAVGNASRKNPISILIPCHRVVGAQGHLTGYGGGLEKKKWLLSHEQAGNK